MALGSEVTDDTALHRTRLEDVCVGAWYPLDVDREVTRLPLWDSRFDLFARLTYKDGLEFAQSIGAELVSREDLTDLLKVAIIIEPVTLPATAQMRTLAWSRRHDAEVMRRLDGVDDCQRPVLGAGKHWIRGAPKGRAHLMGWWTQTLQKYGPRRGAGWIQQPSPVGGQGPHDDGHYDYATTTMLVRARR